MKHFTEDDKKSILSIILMILMMPLMCASIWLFYEYWGKPKYWRNRWRLYRLLKKNKVKIKSVVNYSIYSLKCISNYTIDIEDQQYILRIWDGQDMTLNDENQIPGVVGSNYIGLFKGSLITKLLNKKTIKKIIEISDIQKIRNRKLEKIGIY